MLEWGHVADERLGAAHTNAEAVVANVLCQLRIIRLQGLVTAREQRAACTVFHPQGNAIVLFEEFDQTTRKVERFFTRYLLQSKI